MLIRTFPRGIQGSRRSQRGVVLVIALIAMVAMTLATIALIRSVDTTNIIAGNLAFQKAAMHSSDAGVEDAIFWLESCNVGTPDCALGTLDNDDSTRGYSANGTSIVIPHSPAAGQTWDAYWEATLKNRPAYSPGLDAAGNTPFYVIDRLCQNPGPPTGGASCAASPTITVATGNAEEANEVALNAPSLVYYRITVRVAGPRNTASFVQAIVAL